MNNDDQWFEPGDKVMRVADWDADDGAPPTLSQPKYGTVYCVDDFFEARGGGCNIVSFVGDGGFTKIGRDLFGWPASAFRKVTEIQLITRAVKRLSEPVESQSVEPQNV